MKTIAGWMADVIDAPDDEALIGRIAGQVKELCDQFEAPGITLS